MNTIRRRLTVWYAVALGLAMAAFGLVLYLERRQSTFQELDGRLQLEAQFAARWLVESKRVVGRLTDRAPGRPPALDPGVAAYFENVRDALVLADAQGRVLYASAAARELGFEGIEQLVRLGRAAPASSAVGTVTGLRGGDHRWAALPLPRLAPEAAILVVAVDTDEVAFGPAALVQSMLAAAPVIVLAALMLGYLIAGRALGPMVGIVDELEAITDGRSLHRRLAVPMTGDEVSRLAQTLNGMLARLEQSFGTLRRFTADASHELKTPLMVVRAGVERALTDARTPGELVPALDEALGQVNRMSHMVESLLTLARVDEGRAPLAFEPHDLRALVQEAGETAEMLGEPAGIAVTVDVPEAAEVLPVDAERIRQLLMNLVTNAIKYTPAGGRVDLALERREQAVVLAVRDTGIGISPGDVDRIFDRFFRGDQARSRTGDRPGTGLGLAICKWIAEAHGGSITVASRPGKGSAFLVALPRPAPAPGGEA
ncbi:MAG: ATP-binding protein [Gemmatimonadales bacterium]|nr:ATP-binding protein [Gemmatimonadales bacterium]